MFLHVITYNTAAMSLYSRQGFSCVAKLRGFYFIATGRTPDPQQQVGVWRGTRIDSMDQLQPFSTLPSCHHNVLPSLVMSYSRVPGMATYWVQYTCRTMCRCRSPACILMQNTCMHGSHTAFVLLVVLVPPISTRLP